jgi:hypothetical protein
MDRFLFSGYSLSQYHGLLKARESARVVAHDRENWRKHFENVIRKTKEKLSEREMRK